MKLEARICGSVAPYTDEQLKAIRPSKLFPCHSCLLRLLTLLSFIVVLPSGVSEGYDIPFRPIGDPVAAARARERRRKMFAFTKATFYERSPGSLFCGPFVADVV